MYAGNRKYLLTVSSDPVRWSKRSQDMASSQQMKASSSSHQCQMRLDEKVEHNCTTLDLTWYSCSYALKYYTFLESTSSCRDCIRIPLLLFTIKSSLPGAETSFSYMFSSSSLLVLLFLFHSQISIMELLHTKTQKPDLWWQPSFSILSKAQQEQLLPPFLQKDVIPSSEPPFLSFDVFKTLKVSNLLGDTLHFYASLVLE